MPAEAKPNPLAPQRTQMAPTEHPVMPHAKIWQHVQSIAPKDLPGKTDTTSYVTPLLGALAGNPKVTSKDVIKAAAQAAGDGKIPPSQAVEFISSMPDDPSKLQGWLKGLYAAHVTALVHMKAAAMQQAEQAQGTPQPAAPSPSASQAMPQTGMPP